MVFSDLTFIYLFLPVTLVLYYIAPKKLRNLWLLITGLIFYAWGEPSYVIIMVISTMIDYIAGLVLWKFDGKPAVRKAALIISLTMNLALLGLFKYSGFIVSNLNSVFHLALKEPNPLGHLPIGISFFTFQSMSYTIDMYMRNIKVQKNPVSFAAFVTMFPQVVAGPIVRYEDVAKELDDRTIDTDIIYDGIKHFTIGLGKKVLIANNIGILWDTIKSENFAAMPALTAWLGIISFTLQIYFDFSGYSDMAVGLGKLLGFNFPQNFNYPYMSKSISEFWRRWHMTLGGWFKSYVYFPLGGSRKGTGRTVINLAIVWLLTGIWHGASWNFIVWGCFYGVLIIAEKLFLGDLLKKIPAIVTHLYTMLFVIIGWVIFDTPNLGSAGSFIKAMFGGTGILYDTKTLYNLSEYLIILVIAVFGCTNLSSRAAKYISEKLPAISRVLEPAGMFCLTILSTSYLVDASYNPFLYFNF